MKHLKTILSLIIILLDVPILIFLFVEFIKGSVTENIFLFLGFLTLSISSLILSLITIVKKKSESIDLNLIRLLKISFEYLFYLFVFVFLKGFSVYILNPRTFRQMISRSGNGRTISSSTYQYTSLRLDEHFEISNDYNFILDDFTFWMFPILIFIIGNFIYQKIKK